ISARLAAASLRFSGARLFTVTSLSWSRRWRMPSPVVPDSPSTKTAGFAVTLLAACLVSRSVMAVVPSTREFTDGHERAVVKMRPQGLHPLGDLSRRRIALRGERIRDRDLVLVGLVPVEL